MLLISQQARADVWGYVDARGVAHFATEPLDERYQLFARQGQVLGLALGSPAPSATVSPAMATTEAPGPLAGAVPPRLLTFFEVSPAYKQVKHLLREAASQYQIDYELLQALIATESGFDPAAVSPKGAVGLMQLMPATAQRYGVQPAPRQPVHRQLTDPRLNIHTGARYLRDLLRLFPGQLELALAAYNAGEGAVQRAGHQVPNYPETRQYVRTVMQLYQALKPPPLVQAERQAPKPASLELPGGAAGRGNMIRPLQAVALAPLTPRQATEPD